MNQALSAAHCSAVVIGSRGQVRLLNSGMQYTPSNPMQNESPNFAVLTLPYYDDDCITVRRRSYVKFRRGLDNYVGHIWLKFQKNPWKFDGVTVQTAKFAHSKFGILQSSYIFIYDRLIRFINQCKINCKVRHIKVRKLVSSRIYCGRTLQFIRFFPDKMYELCNNCNIEKLPMW